MPIDQHQQSSQASDSMHLDELSNVLRDVHAQNMATFQRILTSDRSTLEENRAATDRFWDIVVITAGDLQQRLCYQRQIDFKLSKGQIPRQAKYHVIEDPPKSKIGSGGSTCLVMNVLNDQYSDDFISTARVLLIHAGGYSTRLPHVSARGKVFTILPQVNSPDGIQVLDLKLVLYLHLLKSMPPGVFLTSADGIELLSSKAPFPSDPKPLTITSLAHPSSTAIGSTHGVYLLQDTSDLVQADRALQPKDQSAILTQCLEFLHKPSLDRMKRIPGVIFNGISGDKDDIVYTDSCYYFDPQTAKVMAKIWKTLPLDCDLEAWADVLSFQQDSPISPSLIGDPHQQGRHILSEALREAKVKLDVMVLNASKFYHLGTMLEFLEGVCIDRAFMAELHIQNHLHPQIAQVGAHTFQHEKTGTGNDSAVIELPVYLENSVVHAQAKVHAWSLVVDTDLGENTILPANTCIFTLQIREQAYVTFTVSVKDDMKKEVEGNESGKHWLHRLRIYENVPVARMVPGGALESRLSSSNPDKKVSLWTAPIFEVASTKTESINLAMERLDRIRDSLSRSDTMGWKDSNLLQSSTDSRIIGWTSFKEAARSARDL
ncbi:fucose-1-phosphate guanylyltransferase [Entomortierella parvispora]|uniref:Fucose-1-phosphate guanylyltransferase n=1 Tax=Entomortierella parvispora TaxID=205924 RepID=A0A9P3HAS9_9FUNG|nr:fucose-1-phosphate guanylyltransferase [Entomortierella parvispora]